jgi:beta-glucanase (GH16 family)
MKSIGKRCNLNQREFTGQFPNKAHTNFFYKGIPEYTHEEMHLIDSSYDQYHVYTIDWKHDRLVWLIDEVPVRTVHRNDSLSPMTPHGERWFPSTPSQIQ